MNNRKRTGIIASRGHKDNRGQPGEHFVSEEDVNGTGEQTVKRGVETAVIGGVAGGQRIEDWCCRRSN